MHASNGQFGQDQVDSWLRRNSNCLQPNAGRIMHPGINARAARAADSSATATVRSQSEGACLGVRVAAVSVARVPIDRLLSANSRPSMFTFFASFP